MFESIMKLVRKVTKKEDQTLKSKDAAKERLHLVLMQDRANVSADFLELMKQEIIEVIKKYIDVDESAIDVRLTNKENGDGTNGAPALYANIPILNIKNEARKIGPEDEEKQAKNDKIEKTAKKDEIKTKNKQNSEKVAEKVEQAEEIIEEVKAEKEENKKDKKQVNTKKKTEEKSEETEVK
mgnify:CR=1 FL=1